MSLDGIKRVRKKRIAENYEKIVENYEKNDSNFWHGENRKNRNINLVPKKLSSKKSKINILPYLLNKRVFVTFIISFLIVALTLTSAYSYLFVKDNYDFVKLFKDGKYLVLFQNNTELRATGGFIGSFATIEIKNGKLINYNFNTNIYKLDNEFVKNNSIKPADSVLADFVPDKKLAMRDSNWSVDFPTAAEQVAWFYEKEGGTPVDGVIAINATVMVDYLKLTGPVDLPDYNTSLTSENFLSTVQYKIEKEYYLDPENKIANEPKSILKAMMEKLLARLTGEKKYLEAINLVKKELQEKQILFYFYDDNKEKISMENNWAGDVKQVNGDYLYINNSNLGSNKSSLNVSEKFELNSSSLNNTITNTLTITRTHSGSYDWPDGENKNYMRILVPYGAKIISASLDNVDCLKYVETKKEAGKTEFALWVNIVPRSSRILSLSYTLPDNISKTNHTLYLQKQSGNLGDEAKVIIDGIVKFDGKLMFDQAIK